LLIGEGPFIIVNNGVAGWRAADLTDSSSAEFLVFVRVANW
jgi:hypothetical protein